MQAHDTPPGLPSIGGSVAPPADSGQPKHVGGVASDGGESVLTARCSACGARLGGTLVKIGFEVSERAMRAMQAALASRER